ncbi:MAG: hypothetical protein KGI47_10055 [Betaproteobacteria bacterium]|nr:hypothetical protein [Betaproteobacteria bacterium]
MDRISQAPLSACFSKPGLTAGTTTTYTTAAATVYSIRGKMYSEAAQTNAATPTTDADTGAAFNALSANQGCVFLFMYNASGTLGVTQSGIQGLDVAGNFIVAPNFPAIPEGYTPFGYLVAKAGSTLSGTWTFGTNNLSGVTGMTYAFQDIATLPDRPQVS